MEKPGSNSQSLFFLLSEAGGDHGWGFPYRTIALHCKSKVAYELTTSLTHYKLLSYEL